MFRWRDHPRVCGEHLWVDTILFIVPGSSPRMRGAQPRLQPPLQLLGIIPAYAGSTFHLFAVVVAPLDHPRVCGEHSGIRCWKSLVPGSSPRMRGARERAWPDSRLRGIIPAYAGSTRRRGCSPATGRGSSPRMRGALKGFLLRTSYIWDHPRVCGEHHRGG